MKEEWKDIPGCEGHYQITETGNVRCFLKGRKWVDVKGYMITGYKGVSITINNVRKQKLLHKLLAMTWLPNPNGYKVVNHKDGNKLNNALSNLEWCTKSHDVREAYRLGLSSFKGRNGEENPVSKLKKEEIKEIRNLLTQGIPQREIAKMFGTCQANICLINTNKRWAA